MAATASVKRPENAYYRIVAGTPSIRVDMHISKKEKNRCDAPASFEAPTKIQPPEHSKGSGIDGVSHNLGSGL